MELRSRVLANVESGDLSPGDPGPSTLQTEGSGELVPVNVTSCRSTINIVGASPSQKFLS